VHSGDAPKILAQFFKSLVEGESDVPIDLRRRFAASLAANLHPNIERRLMDVEGVAEAIGVRTIPVVTFNGTHSVVVESFVGVLRQAVSGRKTTTIARADGTKSKVKLQYAAPSNVTIAFEDGSFTFNEVDLLSSNRTVRRRAFKRVFSAFDTNRSPLDIRLRTGNFLQNSANNRLSGGLWRLRIGNSTEIPDSCRQAQALSSYCAKQVIEAEYWH